MRFFLLFRRAGGVRLDLIVIRVVFKLFPTMTPVTIHTLWTAAFFVGLDLFLGPISTLLGFVAVFLEIIGVAGRKSDISSLILGIVEVHACVSGTTIVGTGDCFVLVYVEVIVLFLLMEQFDLDFGFTVCKATIFSIFTIWYLFEVFFAELHLVMVWVVHMLDIIGRILAVFTSRAILMA